MYSLIGKEEVVAENGVYAEGGTCFVGEHGDLTTLLMAATIGVRLPWQPIFLNYEDTEVFLDVKDNREGFWIMARQYGYGRFNSRFNDIRDTLDAQDPDAGFDVFVNRLHKCRQLTFLGLRGASIIYDWITYINAMPQNAGLTWKMRLESDVRNLQNNTTTWEKAYYTPEEIADYRTIAVEAFTRYFDMRPEQMCNRGRA
jgi:hypothetical protein